MTPKSQTFTLSDRAMLVSLELSRWSGQMIDKTTTQEVLTGKGAESDAGNFRKHLIPPKALASVQLATSRARVAFKQLTLPWDNGVGIIPAERFMEFREIMDKLKREYLKAADDFADRYPALRDGAKKRLGDLYNEGDLPDAVTIRDRFDFRVVVWPVPDKADFRVDLGADAVASIRSQIERTVGEKFAAAQHDLWERVLDVVRHFADTMKGGGMFKASTVDKLKKIASEAKGMTLVPDAKLDATCKELEKLAKSIGSADDLRDDVTKRAKAAVDAAEAVKRIERRMKGAF